MSSVSAANLELFETEFLQDFKNLNITAIVDYIKGKNNSLIITGDSSGVIRVFERKGSKLAEIHQLQKGKSKINNLLVNQELNTLYILTGGSLFIYELPNFNDHTPKESEGESKHLKDIAKIVENENPKQKSELMIISKKKKILFFYYNKDNQRLLQKEYKDKNGKNIEINLKEIPEKIRWYGDCICYYLQQQGKLVFLKIETDKNGYKSLTENSQDVPIEEIVYIQQSWSCVYTGGICVFLGMDGNPSTINPITFDSKDPMIELGIFNDIYIISLNQKSVAIYDYNDGQCVQELTTDTTQIPYKKYLAKGQKGIFVMSITKEEKQGNLGKEIYNSNLWELREFSFEEQIKLSLRHDQIDKAIGILNNKLEYNMDKFDFLENFYCDCAWNCFNKKSQKGFEEAEKYFSLCNFNPIELIYHFIKMLKIKPIHEEYSNINELPKEINECQVDGDWEKDINIKAGLNMLVNTLQSKKKYLLGKNNLLNIKKDIKNLTLIETAKKTIINFESSQNSAINLKELNQININLEQVINMINEVLVKSMVMLNKEIEDIENVFDYKYNLKYKEAFDILEKYLNDTDKNNENKKAKFILENVLTSFGKNSEYTDEFEHGLRILLKNDYESAFKIVLSNELISIDNFLKILDDIDKDNPKTSKKESFLQKLCEDEKYQNYSNDKYQTSYLEKIFDEHKKDSTPPTSENKQLMTKYSDLHNKFIKFKNYNKSHILALIEDSWMYNQILYLYTELQKYNEAIQKYVELVMSEYKTFEDIRKYCQENYCHDPDIFKKYFIILKNNYDEKKGEVKDKFKKEMLKILELFVKNELLDDETKKTKNKLELLNILNPKEILNMIPDDWKLNEPLDPNDKSKTLFNLLRFYLKEYAVINNNYKRLENLAKMDLMYKKMKLHELRDKHVLLDVNTSCGLCNKKIQNNTVFLVYPNGNIYHSGCSPDLHIEIKTGRNFENFDY